ncbi:(2Fe-2S)-binding protein [Pigmentiphaga sp.]|jgi:Aerobic-type carbon monoxide dehydrogenase, small subunit CoxS/CutS homologs|uniref:(2Fe-2S)-binding protein n=1 Tax=Pigmentiphaga sp. TaxID=1977564 RepID=UPI0025E1C49D|nr:(2Fe-2S)-binding protein [Pigmentiphaga sp.]MBX6318994.1 (2Fe-2S)-binding protein [Pigmentiphaga sp.]
MKLALTVNRAPVTAEVEDRLSLADFLRDHCGLTGTHLGCEHGVCGACSVLLDGEPVRACITLAAAVDGREVTTIEGLDDDASMAVIRECFSEAHGLQCGFCTPGMVIMVRDALARGRCESESQVRQELAGNLCRCTGYAGIVKAALLARDRLNAAGAPAPSSQQKEASLP